VKTRLGAFALALALVAGPASAQWMFRGGPAHPGTAEAAPRHAPRVKWRFPTGDRVVSSLAWHEGVVYFGSDDGRVYAVAAATGRQLWMAATNGPVPSTPAVKDGVVYATSYDGRLYALDARTGARRFTFRTNGERRFEARGLHGMQPARQTFFDPFDVFLSSPAVAGGVVYFGSGDGRIYAVDAASGQERWHVQTGDVVHASPAVAGGLVYAGSWDGDLYALDAATGEERWRFHGGRDDVIHNQVGFQSSPAVAGGVVYVGCRDSKLYALDAATGKERWRYDNEGSWVVGSPAVANGRVYFATSDSRRFHVLDAATGSSVASQTSSAYMFSSPTVAGDVVLIGVLNGTLEARDAGTGALVWSYEVEASHGPAGRALAADRTFDMPVLYPSSRGVDTIAGYVRQTSVGAIFSTPVVAQGLVLFGSADGAVYALE
jgi:eukaryotic-like serine/threonine-protein kinase